MNSPIFPGVVAAGVPVLGVGFSGNLKTAFCAVAMEGFPSRNGPVIYVGIPLVLIYTLLPEYRTICTLATAASLIGMGLPAT